MKNIVIAATCIALSGVGFAGVKTSATVKKEVEIVSASYMATESVSAPCKSACAFSWEVAAVYNHALTDINEKANTPSIDTYGLDVTGIYSIQGNHKATLRFGFAHGEACDYDVWNFSLMPGYRYEYPIDEKLTAFAGAGFGLGLSMLDNPATSGKSYGASSRDDMANFVYNVEVGARYALNAKFDIIGALMINGGTSPFHSAEYSSATEEQVNVGLRVGIGGKF